MHPNSNIVEAERASSYHNEGKGMLKGKSEAERALNLHLEHGELQWTEDEEKKLLRKLDLLILPLTFFSTAFTYADTGTYGVAAIFGMIKDLKLYDIISLFPLKTSTVKYSWTSSIPTFSLLVTLLPILVIAQRLPLGKVFSVITIWAGFFALMMLVVHDFAGTMVVRALYGFQAANISITIIYLSFWYTQSEQSMRIGIISMGASAGSLMGKGLDLAAIYIGGTYAQSPWRWMYVVVGSVTMGLGILDLFFLPDSPTKTRFFTERERAIAIERVRRNGTGMQSMHFKLKETVVALRDPQVWCLVYIAFVVAFAASALGSFGALLVTSFGYTPERALKLLMPASGIAMVIMFTSGYLPTRFPNTRVYIAMTSFLIAIAGNLILWRSPRDDKTLLLVGLYMSTFFYGAYIHVQSLLTSNVGGNSKKTTATSLIFVLSSVGSIVAPFAYKGQEAAEGYPTGIITGLSLMIGAIFALAYLRFRYARYNKKSDETAATRFANGDEDSPVTGFGDLEETQVPYFRYQY